jgi:hypothetical protein
MFLVQIGIKLFDGLVTLTACRLKQSSVGDLEMAASELQKAALLQCAGHKCDGGASNAQHQSEKRMGKAPSHPIRPGPAP